MERLTCGCAWVVGILVLAALLFPIFAQSTDGHRTTCRSNLMQLGLALMMYTQDYDERLPPPSALVNGVPSTFPALLDPYIKNGLVWKCPEDPAPKNVFDGTPGDWSVSFGYNWLGVTRHGKPLRLDEFRSPKDTLGIGETNTYLLTPRSLQSLFGGSPAVYRHHETLNAAFLDGHVRAIRRNELEPFAPGSTGISAYWHLP